MLISVVITCYNLERYIAEAIESVLRQDFSGDLEIIVVDDASTDSSAQIIETYDRVHLVRMIENSGVLLATICGIEAANGDLVFFLDGDDVWATNKISTVVVRMNETPDLALITHDLSYINQDGRTLNQQSIPALKMSGVLRAQESEMIRSGILMHDDYVWLGSALGIRKSKCKINEFCAWAKALPDPRNTYQDWPLAFWIAALPEVKMAYVSKKLFFYRLHGANHSGDSTTIDKAYRNILRGRNTGYAILDIAQRCNLTAAVQHSAAQNVLFSEYLLSLYSGRRVAAFRNFIVCIPFIFSSSSSALKESARFILIQILTPRIFIYMRHLLSSGA